MFKRYQFIETLKNEGRRNHMKERKTKKGGRKEGRKERTNFAVTELMITRVSEVILIRLF